MHKIYILCSRSERVSRALRFFAFGWPPAGQLSISKKNHHPKTTNFLKRLIFVNFHKLRDVARFSSILKARSLHTFWLIWCKDWLKLTCFISLGKLHRQKWNMQSFLTDLFFHANAQFRLYRACFDQWQHSIYENLRFKKTSRNSNLW